MSAAISLAEVPGDVLSPSAATIYTNCGAKYLFGRVLKMPDPPTGALTMGNAVHAAIGENFSQKIETKRDLPAPGVKAIYLDAWDKPVAGTQPNRGGRPSLGRQVQISSMRVVGDPVTYFTKYPGRFLPMHLQGVDLNAHAGAPAKGSRRRAPT